MEQLFETVLTTEVALTALAVGGVQEVAKQAINASAKGKEIGKTAWYKTSLALSPLFLGAGFGQLVISPGGVAEPWILGIVSGLFAGTIYNTVKPGVKAAVERKVQQ